MNLRQKIIIALIILITLTTRFIGLDRVPPHLSNDEISIAYDAYSVSQTLRDEHNHFLPIVFQSHGTYKAPLAIYLTIPTTILLGNNEYTARLPSVIFGSLTVLILGLLVYELTKNLSLTLVSSLVLAITPWHIYTSRMILESNLALFFVVTGIWLFFRGLNRQQNLITLTSFVCFALSVYSYHTEWVFTPMILVVLILLNYKVTLKKPIYYISGLLFLILIAPIFFNFLMNSVNTSRANTELIFKEANLERALRGHELNLFQKGQIIIHAVLGSYSSYLDLGYLFFDGLNLTPRTNPYQIGLFLSPFLLCFLIGFFSVKKFFKNQAKFIFIWAAITPLVPALTRGGPNQIRNLISIAPYTIIIALGCLAVWNYLKKKRFLLILALFLILFSFVYFCVLYYLHFSIQAGENFQYGYKQIAQYIKNHYLDYEKIIIDPRFGDYNKYDGVPHLYIPYFTALDPHQLLKREGRPTGLYFDKYEIRAINWNLEKTSKNFLYVVPYANSPSSRTTSQVNHLLEIQLPNFKPAFELYKGKN